MSIFEIILRIFLGNSNKPKQEQYKNNNDSFKSLADQLYVPKEELQENPVQFRNLENIELQKLYKRMYTFGVRLNKQLKKSKLPISGELNGDPFISIKNEFISPDLNGQIICTEHSDYDIKTLKTNLNKGIYNEKITHHNGTKERFSANFGLDSSEVLHIIETKNGIRLLEAAYSYDLARSTNIIPIPPDELLDYFFVLWSQPRIMLTNEQYERIKDKTSLGLNPYTLEQRDEDIYVIYIEVSKQMDENITKKKSIEYLYYSPKSYKQGEKPFKISIYEDNDGKTQGHTFRLKEDLYIEWGRSNTSTKSLDQIKKLAGKMPTQPTQRVDLATNGHFRMPPGIQQIYEKAIATEKEAVLIKE